MKFLFSLMALSMFLVACNQGKNEAGATGSGAGVERQEEYNDKDANITTPIDSRDDLEEEE